MARLDYVNLKEKTTHGDYAFPYIWYYSEIPNYFKSYPMHWHDEMEVINVFEGEMEININLSTTIIHQHEIAIIKPGVLHSFKQSGTNSCRYLSLLFHPKILGNALTDYTVSQYILPFLSQEILIDPIIHASSPGYKEILYNLDTSFNIYDRKKIYYEIKLKSLLFDLIYEIMKSCVIEQSHDLHVKAINAKNIKIIIDYIHGHYTNEITILELANLVHLSEHYFMKFFKKNTGITCVEYINDYRISLAANQLCNFNTAINKIANSVGIDNISYFNRLFKKKFGMTPKQYRQKYYYKA